MQPNSETLAPGLKQSQEGGPSELGWERLLGAKHSCPIRLGLSPIALLSTGGCTSAGSPEVLASGAGILLLQSVMGWCEPNGHPQPTTHSSGQPGLEALFSPE